MKDWAPTYSLGSNIMFSLGLLEGKKSTLILCIHRYGDVFLLPFVRILLPARYR